MGGTGLSVQGSRRILLAEIAMNIQTPPPVTVRVCDSLSCAMAGAERSLAELPQKLGNGVRVVRAPCMGACDRAPACAVGHVQITRATADNVVAFARARPRVLPFPPGADFDAYRAAGGYALLCACLDGQRTREDIIAAL